VARKDRGGEQSPELARLPPGRHGLPREFVTENQRGRLAAGTIQAIVECGYHEATVSQIVAAAGLSRRTFYQYFSDKEECFIDTYAIVEDFLLAAMREAGEGAENWPAQVRAQLQAMLGAFAENPNLALFAFSVPQSAGGKGRATASCSRSCWCC
jgi:AcrR family transcriptional regulator